MTVGLSWFCCVGSLLVAWMFARGWRRPALALSLFMQFPWAALAWFAGQWGAVVCAAAFVVIDIWGLCRRDDR